MKRWGTTRVAGIVALLVLAGCGGAAGPGGTPTGNETLTPVPLPATETPTSSPETVQATTTTPTVGQPRGDIIAPGLSEGGVFDPRELADAHERELGTTAYRFVRTTTVTGASGELQNVTRTLTVASGGTPYYYVERARSADTYPATNRSRVEVWSDGDVPVSRVGIDDVRYRVGTFTSPEGAVGDRTGRDRLATLYASATAWTVTVRNGPDGPHTVETRIPSSSSVLGVPNGLSDPETAELRLVVTPSGRVVSYRLRYEATFDGERAEVVHRGRFRTVDEPVTPPEWLDAAKAAS